MTRKDYEALAREVRLELGAWNPNHPDTIAIDVVWRMANRMADVFAQGNPRFNREKFLKACELVTLR
jgi:hypothetical protein